MIIGPNLLCRRSVVDALRMLMDSLLQPWWLDDWRDAGICMAMLDAIPASVLCIDAFGNAHIDGISCHDFSKRTIPGLFFFKYLNHAGHPVRHGDESGYAIPVGLQFIPKPACLACFTIACSSLGVLLWGLALISIAFWPAFYNREDVRPYPLVVFPSQSQRKSVIIYMVIRPIRMSVGLTGPDSHLECFVQHLLHF